jgi:hypothetical protein
VDRFHVDRLRLGFFTFPRDGAGRPDHEKVNVMEIKATVISQKDIDGFDAYIRGVVFGEDTKKAPVTVLKYSTLLHMHPFDSILIGSENFTKDPLLSSIPREYLRKLAVVAKVTWDAATRMSVSDLIILAREKYVGSPPGDTQPTEDEDLSSHVPGAAEESNPKPTRNTVEERALQQLVIHPDWKRPQIAKQIGCSERSLATGRAPNLNTAMQAYQQRGLPRGSKSDGMIEAIDEG